MLKQRLRLLLPALWAGVLLCIALIATPAPFATLATADAGRVVGRIFAQEAPLSLLLGVLVLMLERQAAQQAAEEGRGSVFSTDMLLALGTLFCTVAGYYALQPMMAAARAGQGAASFALLHGVSLGLFGLKGLLVLALAWRSSRRVAAA
jgi:hypothetical protein